MMLTSARVGSAGTQGKRENIFSFCRRGGTGGAGLRGLAVCGRGRELGLLLSVQLEYVARFVQVEGVSVYDELIFTSVRGHVMDVLNGVAAFAKRLHEKFDIYHAPQFTYGTCFRRVGSLEKLTYLMYENVPQRSVEFETASRVRVGGFCPEKKASWRERPET